MAKITMTPAEHANNVQSLSYPIEMNFLQVGAVAAARKEASILDGNYAIRNLRVSFGTCGTAGNSVVAVRKNGDIVATATVAHDAQDGAIVYAMPTTEELSLCKAGDIVDINVSAAATGAADLVASVSLDKAF